MTSFISVTDAKTQLKITNELSDTQLAAFIAAACDVVDQRCGPIATCAITGELVDLQGRTVFNELTTAGPREFVVRHRPVQSIQAVNSAILSGVSYAPTDFVIDTKTGIIRRADWGTIYGPLTIDYTVGYATVPQWAISAALIIVQALWASQRRTTGARGPGAGLDIPIASGMLPPAAEMLLGPHAMTPAIG